MEVLGRRPDGYHEIRTWIYPISLEDALHIKKTDAAEIILSCDHPGLPVGEENLAYRAAALFMKEAGLSGGVAIELTKRIPIAAGLGGGSSDAAAVLKAMNILWGVNIPREGLMEMGAKIGADVPFFVVGRGAVMGGRGERLLKYLPPLKTWMVLINPGLPLSTQHVYQRGRWGLTKARRDTRILLPPQDLEKVGDFLHNNLEGAALDLMPTIGAVKDRLRRAGSKGVLMTGSGPTVFGLFSEHEEADRAVRDLNMEEGWISFVVHTLSDS